MQVFLRDRFLVSTTRAALRRAKQAAMLTWLHTERAAVLAYRLAVVRL